MSKTLNIDSLHVGYTLADGSVREVVRNVSLGVEPGETLGIVGESGCGKSTLAIAAVGWLGSTGVRLHGRVRLGDIDIYDLSDREKRTLWGSEMVYLPQDAGSALHPTKRIEFLFEEVLRAHTSFERLERRQRTMQALSSVLIDDPERAIQRYPHQFSGGQQQRIALALALVTEPSVLILDEPTTGADATTQDEITQRLKELLESRQLAAVYITHDIALISSLATRLAVMYAGEIVEEGATAAVATRPMHPYSIGLIESVPRLDSQAVAGIRGIPPGRAVADGCAFAPRCDRSDDVCITGPVPRVFFDDQAVSCHHLELGGQSGSPEASLRPHASRSDSQQTLRLAINGLTYTYRNRRGESILAVDDVTMEIPARGAVGIVGESGSGKSTLLAAVAGLLTPEGGTVEFEGERLASPSRRRTLSQRAAIQIIFQDPHSSLNPRQTVRQILANALRRLRPELDKSDYDDEVSRLLGLVRLRDHLRVRYPGALSGGEKQRVALARALAGNPRVLLCDEVVSALDVSVQAVVLNLLNQIRRETGTSIVFVSHDIAAVRLVANHMYVMKQGRIRESGESDELVMSPRDAYTRKLISAIPRMPSLDPAGFNHDHVSYLGESHG